MLPRPLSIWIVSQSYLPYYGGITEHTWHLAAALGARGHCVRIVTGAAGPSGVGPADADPPGVAVSRVGRTWRVPSNGARACVTWGWSLRRRLAALPPPRPDVVHIQSPLEPFLPWEALRRLPGLKIGTFHTAGRRPHWGYRWFAPWLRQRAAGLAARIAVSETAARYVSDYIPGDCVVIPNGVAPERFAAATVAASPGHAASPVRLLCVGRLDPRKGLPELLAAIERLEAPARGATVELTLVGDGPLRAALERRARRHRLPVHFRGSVAREQLAGCYADADLCVAPARDGESFGICLLEALAAGVPIVAADLAGYRETLRGSGAARFYAAGDASSLAAALRRLIRAPAERRALGRAGRRYAARFDWQAIAARTDS